jgi:hypothetical protein
MAASPIATRASTFFIKFLTDPVGFRKRAALLKKAAPKVA